MSPGGSTHAKRAAQVAAWSRLWSLLLRSADAEQRADCDASVDQPTERFAKEN